MTITLFDKTPQVLLVADEAERLALTSLLTGDEVIQGDTGEQFIYNGTSLVPRTVIPNGDFLNPSSSGVASTQSIIDYVATHQGERFKYVIDDIVDPITPPVPAFNSTRAIYGFGIDWKITDSPTSTAAITELTLLKDEVKTLYLVTRKGGLRFENDILTYSGDNAAYGIPFQLTATDGGALSLPASTVVKSDGNANSDLSGITYALFANTFSTSRQVNVGIFTLKDDNEFFVNRKKGLAEANKILVTNASGIVITTDKILPKWERLTTARLASPGNYLIDTTTAAFNLTLDDTILGEYEISDYKGTTVSKNLTIGDSSYTFINKSGVEVTGPLIVNKAATHFKLVCIEAKKYLIVQEPPVNPGTTIFYSLLEINTGTYWVDGKLIYRKSFDQSIANGATVNNLATSIKNLVKANLHLKDTSGTTLPLPDRSTATPSTYSVTSSGGLSVTNQRTASGQMRLIGFVEYTKLP